MLSILIPSYNHDLTDLVEGLHQQAVQLGIAFEVLIIDDFSAAGFRNRNKALTGMSHVRYLQLQENIGRARVRNMLAAKAGYENLLFIDADARLLSENYLSTYIGMLGKDRVICGGTVYGKEPPGDPACRLRWEYGRKREARSVSDRSRDPCRAFSSFQFVATRNILREVPFDEDLSSYGHEDTVFGLSLEREKIPVIHVYNPLLHDGLEPAEEFLDKTRQGLRNLKYLAGRDQYAGLMAAVRILKKYHGASRMGLDPLLKWLYGAAGAWMQKQLKRKNPGLWIFDLYKISYYATLH